MCCTCTAYRVKVHYNNASSSNAIFWGLKCYKVRACENQKFRFNKCGFLKRCWKVKMSQLWEGQLSPLKSSCFVERADIWCSRYALIHFLPYRWICMPTVVFLEALRLYSIARSSSDANVVFSIWVILTQYFSCSSMQKTLKSEFGFKLFEYRFNQGGAPPESIAFIML